jgi:hypothetical protein
VDRKAEGPHAPVVLVKEYRRSGVAFLYAGTWRSPRSLAGQDVPSCHLPARPTTSAGQALTGEPVFR